MNSTGPILMIVSVVGILLPLVSGILGIVAGCEMLRDIKKADNESN